ncbi:MAG TPA: GYD domain-containing protein [Thermoanaerobaculaceae bacterium]|nr:GYD domain-containing protein [Solirubrobacteraceae bacterium]HVN33298.1 GYD domain-containing protein [Thermoanaerobaculaceae bacterium]
MPQFLVQFSYASRSIKSLVEQPDVDHAGQASAMVASLGGRLLGYWYSFGAFDGVVLIEGPDHSTAAAVAMAIGGTGEVSRLETTVLLTMEEAQQASRTAAAATHLPPGEEASR